jgi:uncharacterized membrane protein YjjP (DUF1212 family)
MQRIHTELLASTGRVLLEYNESTGAIVSTLKATARALKVENFDVAVSYVGVVVSLGHDAPVIKSVRELRYNAALLARVHSILGDVRAGKLDSAAALEQLSRAEADTPRHSRSSVALLLGVAAACLAILLGADYGAIAVAGLSTALGVVVRQELHRRHFSVLALPLTAAFVGAALGGLAIRWGWTHTPGLALVVPSLMLVPGPHLINGLFDLIDNYLPMSMARLGLATGILIASALGIVVGIALTLSGPPLAEQIGKVDHLNLISDMLLAGVVTCGFAIYYNAAWSHIGMAALGGMAGHGLRYLALEVGMGLEVATFLGGLAVGVVSALIARSYKLPLAVIAFAGAVTMMPGLQMYRALGGSLRLAQLKNAAEAPTISNTLGNVAQACFVVAALALGLILAARAVPLVVRKESRQ